MKIAVRVTTNLKTRNLRKTTNLYQKIWVSAHKLIGRSVTGGFFVILIDEVAQRRGHLL
ncbi:MAG: hypothetical protein ACSI46_01510 [Gloeotrichia echinulata DVL01]